jgi:hypothetical protein
MEGVGFEPTKAEPADLQSAPFGRLGTPPHALLRFLSCRSVCLLKLLPVAGAGIRTPDLLITNQLLYQLSYTGKHLISLTSLLPSATGYHFTDDTIDGQNGTPQ